MPTDIETQILDTLRGHGHSLGDLKDSVSELKTKIAVIETRLERQPEPMGNGPEAAAPAGIVTLNGKHLYVGGPVLLAIAGAILTIIAKMLGLELSVGQ